VESTLAVAAATWAIAMALGPILQIRRIIDEQSSRGVSISFFVVLLIGFGLWIAYGIAAINLALTLCERGLTVCLVDADIRRGQVHGAFGIPRGPGLAEVLQGKAPFDLACRHARVGEFRRLAVLPSGGPATSPPGLVGSVRMRELLAQLREHYDLVVVDTPPVNILTDAALVGAHADGVLLVVRAGSTDIAALGYAMEQLRHVRAPALGVVLNDVDIKRYSAYDGAYRYASYESYVSADTDQA